MMFFKIRQYKGLWIAWSQRLESVVKLMSKNSISGSGSGLDKSNNRRAILRKKMVKSIHKAQWIRESFPSRKLLRGISRALFRTKLFDEFWHLFLRPQALSIVNTCTVGGGGGGSGKMATTGQSFGDSTGSRQETEAFMKLHSGTGPWSSSMHSFLKYLNVWTLWSHTLLCAFV